MMLSITLINFNYIYMEKRLNSNFLKVSFLLDFSKKNYRITIHSFNHDIAFYYGLAYLNRVTEKRNMKIK